MWSKKKQKEGWHLSGISGVGPITAPSRTHALWHQVSLCALQTRPRPPGSPPRAFPPPGVTEKVRREIIIPSFASHLATSQVRAEPRSVPKNSRGQARSSVCPDGPDEPGGGIYSARCWQGITFQRLGWSLRRRQKKKRKKIIIKSVQFIFLNSQGLVILVVWNIELNLSFYTRHLPKCHVVVE